jgi:hypothetical protein
MKLLLDGVWRLNELKSHKIVLNAPEDWLGVNFIKIVRALFLPIFGCQNNSNPKHSFVIFGTKILAKNACVNVDEIEYRLEILYLRGVARNIAWWMQ